MWLPKDERVLLAHYYNQIGEPDIEQDFRNSQLVELLTLKSSWRVRKIQRKRENDFKEIMQEQSLYRERINRRSIANKTLNERNLITLKLHQHDPDVIVVSLSLEGYDLGRKYSSKSHTILLWCNEYKIWVILSTIIALAGIIISILVAILKD